MKKYINCLLFMLFLTCMSESLAQNYLRIEHPLVKGATTNSVYIKAINITSKLNFPLKLSSFIG